MRLLILYLIGFAAANNISTVERDCNYCVQDKYRAYIKVLTSPNSNPIFLCHRYSLILSQFIVAVDRACTSEHCADIENRSIFRVINSDELSCSSQIETNSSQPTVWLVKECFEIVLICVILGILVIKRSVLRKLMSRSSDGTHIETNV